jgi:RNA polymerase sigma-70 factor (ECF subfamily)
MAPESVLLSADLLAALVEANRARLLRTIAARLHRGLDRRLSPEDVLQEAYLAALTRLPYRASAAYSSDFLWLRAVVIQTVTDCHRHHLGAEKRDALRETTPGAAAAELPSLAQLFAASATSPSGAVRQQETTAAVTAALEQLAAADRDIIVLRHFEDLGNSEIAELLGIEGKAASIRYVRAVLRLKDLLAARGVTLGDLRG